MHGTPFVALIRGGHSCRGPAAHNPRWGGGGGTPIVSLENDRGRHSWTKHATPQFPHATRRSSKAGLSRVAADGSISWEGSRQGGGGGSRILV